MCVMNNEIIYICSDLSAVSVLIEHSLEPFSGETVVSPPCSPGIALKALLRYRENVLDDLTLVGFGHFPQIIKLVHANTW